MFRVLGPDSSANAFELDNASYANENYVGASTITENEVYFKSDGLKMYVLDEGRTVRQYTLSVPWDLTTATYDSKNFSTTAQETAPRGFCFSADGTKCYVVGETNDTVYQYTLSTAWDLSTASYASKSMSVSSQETAPQAVAINSDGTKMYVVGTANDTVYQYTLSTPYDVSTGSYATKSMSVSSQDTAPKGLYINSDGDRVFVAGDTNNTIYQYNLSTPDDISTGSYASKSFSVATQTTAPAGIFFEPNGTFFYVTADSPGDGYIFKYTL